MLAENGRILQGVETNRSVLYRLKLVMQKLCQTAHNWKRYCVRISDEVSTFRKVSVTVKLGMLLRRKNKPIIIQIVLKRILCCIVKSALIFICFSTLNDEDKSSFGFSSDTRK